MTRDPIEVLDVPYGIARTHGVLGFLDVLSGPVWFRVPGRDDTRCRVVVTLQHGNEPSGSVALWRLLQHPWKPAVDLYCCIVSVDVALCSPPFSWRALPGERDQNRCFAGPFEDRRGRIAAALVEHIEAVRPEAILDLHNTSGNGPAYGVATRVGVAERTLTSLFTPRLVHTQLKLGTLLEVFEGRIPCVALECGGAREAGSHDVAELGLRRLGELPNLLEPACPVQLQTHPVRVELLDGASVRYGGVLEPFADVVLAADFDRHTFQRIEAGSALGWLGPRGLEALRVVDEAGRDRKHELFEVDSSALVNRIPFTPLMVTTDPAIAASDCLFYAVGLAPDPA